MKSYKKLLSALMAVAMLSGVTGCQQKNNNDGIEKDSAAVSDDSITDENSVQTEADNNSAEGENVETILAEDYYDSTPVGDPDDIIMTINGRDITLAEYRYYFLNLKASADYGDNSYWNGTSYENEDGTVVSAEENAKMKLDSLKEQVLVYLKNNYTVELFAENNNISLSDDEIKEAEQKYNNMVEEYKTENSLDDEGWKKYLESIYCNDEIYRKSVIRQSLEYKNIRELFEDEFKENVLPDYVMAKHILFKTTGAKYDAVEIPEGATDEEIEKITAQNVKLEEEANAKLKEEQLALAKEVLEKAKNGDDFDALIKAYNEDPGEVANDDGTYDGYVFTTGEMVEEFEKAAFALKPDEISDIVETNYGYHIIKRVEISEKYLDENIIDIMMTNEEYYKKYADSVQSLIDNADIKYNDIYDKVNVLSLT